MIGWGLLFLLLPNLLVVVQTALYPSLLLSCVCIAAVHMVAAMLGNQLYLSRCMRILSKINAAHAGEHRRRIERLKAGGVSYTALVVVLALTAAVQVVLGLFADQHAQNQRRGPAPVVFDRQQHDGTAGPLDKGPTLVDMQHATIRNSAGQWQFSSDPDAVEQMRLRRARFVEDRERLAMSAWPAGTATQGHQCMVTVSLLRDGQVADAQPDSRYCDLDWADRTNLVSGLRRLNFRIEGSDDLFEHKVTLLLPFIE